MVSADGRTVVVGTAPAQLTRDRGLTWRSIEGVPAGLRIVADKVEPQRFYALDPAAGRLLRSDDGAASFHPIAGRGLPADLADSAPRNRETPNALLAVPGQAGALWLLVGHRLFRSLDAGEHWTAAGGALAVDLVGLGRGAPGSRWPALYATGRLGTVAGVWRSIDGGEGWRRINDDTHQWGLRWRVIAGDPRRYGRIYLGTDGRGIVYGDPVGEKR